MSIYFPKLEENVELCNLDKIKRPVQLVEENAGQNRASSTKYPGFKLDDDARHWSPTSQWYAPADILLQYLRNGWWLDKEVEICIHRCGSCRHVEMYHFTLHHAEKQTLRVPVLANPVVRKMVHQYRLTTLYVLNEAAANNTD